jgi:hypothetical protein
VHAMNIAMAGTGQPEWNHTYNCCMRHLKDKTGHITSVYCLVITDDVSLGHPCCAVHDCKEPLIMSKHQYCPSYLGMKDKCAVMSCAVVADPGFWTCPKPGHQAAEDRFTECGKVMFQLKEPLVKTYKMRTVDAVASIHLPPKGS